MTVHENCFLKPMVIKNGVWILLPGDPVNSKQALSTTDDYGRHRLRSYMPDNIVWSMAGAKRVRTYDFVWILACHSQQVPCCGRPVVELVAELWAVALWQCGSAAGLWQTCGLWAVAFAVGCRLWQCAVRRAQGCGSAVGCGLWAVGLLWAVPQPTATPQKKEEERESERERERERERGR